MTSLLSQTAISQRAEVTYPSSDGEPLAETSVHVDAIINTVIALRNYLEGQQAIVLADQFLYYVQGFPKLRVAPDVMVVFNVPPGARDSYRLWEEGQLPAVILALEEAEAALEQAQARSARLEARLRALGEDPADF